MNNLIETIEYRGYEIEVCRDTDACSPDFWGNDDAFIVYDHRDFTITRKGFDPCDIFRSMEKGKVLYNGYWFFPLYAYIHSGVNLSLGRGTDRWDTSFNGFVLVQRMKGWTWRSEKAYKVAKGIVEEWNMYLSGDVYGYNSEVGSCWGFYGNEGKKQMIQEAKSEIDYDIEKKLKSHLEKLKIYIKNHVPLE